MPHAPEQVSICGVADVRRGAELLGDLLTPPAPIQPGLIGLR